MAGLYNFNHLYYFYITAKLGTVTEAAKHIHTSQSSLSTQLKSFEAQIGYRLFQKVGRKLELTHEGHAVFGYCQRAFDVTDEMADHFNQIGQAKGPRISLGVSDEIERRFVTDLIAQILREWPGNMKPTVRLDSGSQEALAGAFAINEIEYIFTARPVHSEESANLTETVIPIVMVAKPGLLPKAAGLPHEILRNSSCDLVLPSAQHALRHQIDEYLHDHKILKSIAFESNISTSVTRAVLDGMGVGFLPLPYIRKEVRAKSLLMVGKKPLWDQKFIFYSKKRHSNSLFSRQFQKRLQIFARSFDNK